MKRTIEKSVEIEVPAKRAYDQWTQFEDFPQFMKGVEEVRQIDDVNLAWKVRVAGKPREWRAEICEQIPDKRIAWHTTEGPHNAGAVTFHRITDDRCKVMVQIEYEPDGFVEKMGDVLGLAEDRVNGDLLSFKRFLEERREPTGAWRGEVPSKDEAGRPTGTSAS